MKTCIFFAPQAAPIEQRYGKGVTQYHHGRSARRWYEPHGACLGYVANVQYDVSVARQD